MRTPVRILNCPDPKSLKLPTITEHILNQQELAFLDALVYAALTVDKYTIVIYTQGEMNSLLTEAQPKGVPLVGVYSYRKDPPHIPSGQYHLHLFMKQNQIFAINKDGTAHDRSHGAQIPKKVADALRKEFPDWTIPESGLIESFSEPKIDDKKVFGRIWS